MSKSVLATDLDGTFLEGSSEEKMSLYAKIESLRDSFSLFFVTGRDIPFVKNLIDTKQVPRPDVIIGDVGTTVVEGQSFENIQPVQSWIDSGWSNSEEAIKIMDKYPELIKQKNFGGKRLSYYYYSEKSALEAAQEARLAGFDVLMSANLYFDILPRGIQKGTTLLKLLDFLQIDHEKVLTAGDTLNDLSLFNTGLKGVAVSNSESALVEIIKDKENVYLANKSGVSGILEALEYYRFI
jgi:sucrose-6-phosphatase